MICMILIAAVPTLPKPCRQTDCNHPTVAGPGMGRTVGGPAWQNRTHKVAADGCVGSWSLWATSGQGYPLGPWGMEVTCFRGVVLKRG